MASLEDEGISTLMPVYAGDAPENLESAIESVVDQTVTPDEFVIVVDGDLTPPLEEVVARYRRDHDLFEIVRLPENRGLGDALRVGIAHCSHPYVARMDCDDICVPYRFERQRRLLLRDEEVAVVGSYVGEFTQDPANIERLRTVPRASTPGKFSSFRSLTNHPSVMLRRQAVLDAGNYRSFRRMQDYELWIRMLNCGYTIVNLPEILVKYRLGADFSDRRGGMDRVRTEVRIQQDLLRNDHIQTREAIRNLVMRIPMHAAPANLRDQLYDRFLRDQPVAADA